MPEIGDIIINRNNSKYVIDISNIDLSNETNIDISSYISDFNEIFDAINSGMSIYLRFTWQNKQYMVEGDCISYKNLGGDPYEVTYLLFNCNILEYVEGTFETELEHYQYIQHTMKLDLSQYIPNL